MIVIRTDTATGRDRVLPVELALFVLTDGSSRSQVEVFDALVDGRSIAVGNTSTWRLERGAA